MSRYILGLRILITIAFIIQLLLILVSFNEIQSIFWNSEMFEKKTSKLDSVSYYKSGKHSNIINFVGFVRDSGKNFRLLFEPGRSMKYVKTAGDQKIVCYWIKYRDTIGFIANNHNERFCENWKYRDCKWSIFWFSLLFGLLLIVWLFFKR